jgi:hypothetical protein
VDRWREEVKLTLDFFSKLTLDFFLTYNKNMFSAMKSTILSSSSQVPFIVFFFYVKIFTKSHLNLP